MAIDLAFVIPAGGWSSGGGVDLDLGVTTSAGREPAGALADDVDPITGELVTLAPRVHPIDAAVRFHFSTVNASGASVQTIGHRFASIRKKGDTAEQQIANEARRVLEPFVARRLVRVEELVTDVDDRNHGNDGAGQLVTYRNRVTSTDQNIATP